jgi:hypothetical protein
MNLDSEVNRRWRATKKADAFVDILAIERPAAMPPPPNIWKQARRGFNRPSLFADRGFISCPAAGRPLRQSHRRSARSDNTVTSHHGERPLGQLAGIGIASGPATCRRCEARRWRRWTRWSSWS